MFIRIYTTISKTFLTKFVNNFIDKINTKFFHYHPPPFYVYFDTTNTDKHIIEYMVKFVKKKGIMKGKYMETEIVEMRIVKKEQNGDNAKELRKIKEKYQDMLVDKIYNFSEKPACHFNAEKIYECIRKIATQINGKSYLASLDDEELELAKIIVEDIYCYLIFGTIEQRDLSNEVITCY